VGVADRAFHIFEFIFCCSSGLESRVVRTGLNVIMASSTDTEDIGSSVVICNAIMISLTTFCIGIRFYTRFFVAKIHGWDDRKSPHLALGKYLKLIIQ